MSQINPNSLANLMPPIRSGDDPRCFNGGKGRKGTKNWKTVYQKLLSQKTATAFKKNPQLMKKFEGCDTVHEALAVAVLQEALNGKLSAIENIQERTEGKVAQKVEVEGAVSQLQTFRDQLEQLPPEKIANAIESFNKVLSAEIVDVATEAKKGKKKDEK